MMRFVRHPWLHYRYHSVTLAFECSVRGHRWRNESVGVIGLEILVCEHCGHYRGHRKTREDGRLFTTRIEQVEPGRGLVHVDPVSEEPA